MKLRKVAELPPRSRSSKYEPVVAQVKKSPGQWFALDTDVENPSQLAQDLKNKFKIKASIRNGVIYLKAESTSS